MFCQPANLDFLKGLLRDEIDSRCTQQVVTHSEQCVLLHMLPHPDSTLFLHFPCTQSAIWGPILRTAPELVTSITDMGPVIKACSVPGFFSPVARLGATVGPNTAVFWNERYPSGIRLAGCFNYLVAYVCTGPRTPSQAQKPPRRTSKLAPPMTAILSLMLQRRNTLRAIICWSFTS